MSYGWCPIKGNYIRNGECVTLADHESELTAVTEQRDRLAEAMRQMWPFIEEDDYQNCNTPSFNAAILKYKEALQSLTPNA